MVKFKAWLRQDKRRTTMLLFILLFAIIGTVALITSRAATPSIAIEAENGINAPATRVTDSTASGGAALQFNSGSVTGSGITNGLRLGIATGYPYVTDTTYPSKFTVSYASYVDKVSSLGVSWIRTDAIVNGTQPVTVLDQTMSEAKAKKMKILVTWAFGDMNNPSGTISKMTQFLDHWKSLGLDSTIGGYEMGNEPNNADPRFGVQDPAKFATWMKQSYPLLKQRSPNAPVMPGGFAPVGGNVPVGSSNIANPADYLNALYKQNGNSSQNMFDVVAMHPYANSSNDYPEGNMPQSGLRVVYYLRQVMNIYGDQSKQIWGTEGGWMSCGNNNGGTAPFTEAQRTTRLLNDLNEWFFGTHDSTGKRVGYSSKSDLNTGPYMIFKLYKAGTGGSDDDHGLIYTGVVSCGGQGANYEPPIVNTLKFYSASDATAVPTKVVP